MSKQGIMLYCVVFKKVRLVLSVTCRFTYHDIGLPSGAS